MDNPLDAIYWRDEILQILFWFGGEGLGEAAQPRVRGSCLGGDEPFIQGHLQRLADEGYVARQEGEPEWYQLTEWGVQEGGRRFADEFAGLTGQAHGEC